MQFPLWHNGRLWLRHTQLWSLSVVQAHALVHTDTAKYIHISLSFPLPALSLSHVLWNTHFYSEYTLKQWVAVVQYAVILRGRRWVGRLWSERRDRRRRRGQYPRKTTVSLSFTMSVCGSGLKIIVTSCKKCNFFAHIGFKFFKFYHLSVVWWDFSYIIRFRPMTVKWS